MFYIHLATCISPQQTFADIKIDDLHGSFENKLHIIEPSYSGVSPTILRRMGKAVRIGAGAAIPLLKYATALDGIIIGTANGGMEESTRFLKQIIEYGEDMLTPGNFVQSTSNATAFQISLLSSTKGYNITHIHRGLAFENAVIDAAMMISENELNTYLLGGVDEISSYNYKLDCLEGWFKEEEISNRHLYEANSPGSIAGEGAAMFLVNGKSTNAIAKLQAVTTLHSKDATEVNNKLLYFLESNLLAGEQIDLLLSGENGDNRLLHFYEDCESLAGIAAVARFKHMCGEYPTASAYALWLACTILQTQSLPYHMVKRQYQKTQYRNILIYNNHKGMQHSFMLVCKESW
jgi:hypothetical protein